MLRFAALLGSLFLTLTLSAADVLRVSVPGSPALTFELSDLRSMPHVHVSGREHDGQTHDYQGISLHDILVKAGAPSGEKLRGPALQLVVVASARDGYRAAFSLAETDPALTDKAILIADLKDGSALNEAQGPLRLVVPDEKREARWVRQLTRIEVISPSTPKSD